MPNSTNYLGGGGARIEKPHNYYEGINNHFKNKNSVEASRANGVNSTQKIDSGKGVQKPSSEFDRILQKNKSVKNKDNKSSLNNNKKKQISLMDAKQLQYDAARQKISKKVAEEVVKKSINTEANSKGCTGKSSNSKGEEKAGTDIALKDLAIKYEEQIYGIIWNLIFDAGDRDYSGGLGEEIFHKELVYEMQKYTNTGELGPIAESIYQDMVRNKENSKK